MIILSSSHRSNSWIREEHISACTWLVMILNLELHNGLMCDNYLTMFYSESHSVMSDCCDPMDYSPQAPLSLEFSRQEYWSGLPFPSSGDLPYPGVEPKSPALQVDSLPAEPAGKPIMFYSYMHFLHVCNYYI